MRLPFRRFFALRAAGLSVALSIASCASTPPEPPVLPPWTGPSADERAAFASLGLTLAPLELPDAPLVYVADVPTADYQPGVATDDRGQIGLGWNEVRPEPQEPLARLIVAHQAPTDLRVSLLLATWFTRLGFHATVVDLRGFGPFEAEHLLDDHGEGAALTALLEDPAQRAWDGYPTAIVGIAAGGADAIYAASRTPRYEAVLAVAPIPDDVLGSRAQQMNSLDAMTARAPVMLRARIEQRVRDEAERQVRSALDSAPLVQAARSATGCALLLQGSVGEGDRSALERPTALGRSPMQLLQDAMPKATLAAIRSPDWLGMMIDLPDWGDAAALWLIDALLVEPGAACPAFEPLPPPAMASEPASEDAAP